MKMVVKILAICLCLCLCLSVVYAADPAAPSEITKDGITVSISTDKSAYYPGQQINASLTVLNESPATIKNLSLTLVAPKGVSLSGESTQILPVLGATDSTSLNCALSVPVQNQNTDLAMLLVIVGVLTAVAIVAAVFLRNRKKAKQTVSFLLVFSLIGGILPIYADADTVSETLKVSCPVTIEDQTLTINGIVTYDLQTENTVSFESNGGTSVEAQKVKPSQYVMLPENPVKDGAFFIGWYLDELLSQPYNFSTPVTSDMTLFAKWATLSLKVSQKEVMTGESCKVYFYAQTDPDVQAVNLVDPANGQIISPMYDDGKYSVSGDDLPGDGVYSAVLTLSSDTETVNSYAAQTDKGALERSKTVTVTFVAPFTGPELDQMELADQRIQAELFQAEGYAEMTKEARITLAESVLNSLIAEGLIQVGSIHYDVENFTFSYVYASGIKGSVSLKENEEDANGIGVIFEADTNYSAPENTVSNGADLGDAIFLWSFDQSWDSASYRRPFYSETEAEWEAKGLNTDVIWDTTVAHYKELSGYEIIIVSGHGAYHTYDTDAGPITASGLLLHEVTSRTLDQTYAADLKAGRIGRISVQGGPCYAILPAFFPFYYDDGQLDGSFFMAENCEFRGKEENLDPEMANAVLSTSVEGVIGFHNSVMANYSRLFMKEFVDQLMDGANASAAYDAAIAEYGSDDSKYRSEGLIAYPLFEGNQTAMLVTEDIQNPDFEAAGGLSGWETEGDARVISSLGQLRAPNGKSMAALTTGIGSLESDYLHGVEGSILRQNFDLKGSQKKLSFTYDLISEEPDEYVSSEYDDTFLVRITAQGTATDLMEVTINSAQWLPIDGIDFDKGDNTVFHTNWITAELDVSAFSGHAITVEFILYDVGDSIYDTAVLLDNIVIS